MHIRAGDSDGQAAEPTSFHDCPSTRLMQRMDKNNDHLIEIAIKLKRRD